MAGTIHGLATCPRAHECKNIGWQTHPPGQPPSRSSDTAALKRTRALSPLLLVGGGGGWRGGVGALETRVHESITRDCTGRSTVTRKLAMKFIVNAAAMTSAAT